MKRTLALILALVMTMALVACGGQPSTSTPGGASSSGGATTTPPETSDIKDINKDQEVKVEETKTYKKELAIPYGNNITAFDPMLKTGAGPDVAYKMVYNQLVNFNFETNEIEPELAESWVVESANSYVFNLRKGVKFSNGEELTADDIVFTFFERPKAVSGTTGTAIWNYLEAVEVINDYSVRFKMTRDDADVLYRLFLAYFGILNREACEKDPENGQMIGTGGWIVDSWAPGDHVTFVRFDNSWVWEENGMNPTEKIVMRYMTESSARSIALQNKELAANHLVSLSDLDSLKASGNIHTAVFNAETLNYIAFNTTGDLMGNVKLRQAIAYAINYDEIIEFTSNGLATRAYSMWGKSQYGLFEDFDEQFEYNPEKAKQLLTEAGYANGLEIDFIGTAARETVATLLQAQLSQCNIKMNISLLDSAGVTAAVKDGTFDILWYDISLRVDGGRMSFLNDGKQSTNRAKYDNPEMLQKSNEALGEKDDAKRREMYKEVQIAFHEDLPYLPMYYGISVVGWADGVTGIEWTLDAKPDFTHMRWAE